MHWDVKRLLAFFTAIIALYASWLLPGTSAVWEVIDRHTFLFLNSWISQSPFWQHFWAYANHHLTDWLFDGVMLTFFSLYVVHAPASRRKWCTLEVIYTIALFSLTIIFINRYFFSKYLHVRRESPTLVIEGATRLSNIIQTVKIKDAAKRSFPGDHGTTCLLFVITIFLKMGWRYGLSALAITMVFLLPRMVVGAHWLSDIAVGSLSIALFSLAIGHLTPLKHIILRRSLHAHLQQSD